MMNWASSDQWLSKIRWWDEKHIFFWEDYFVKSGKLIYNLDRSFSEYVNEKNSFELFGELENTLNKGIAVDEEDLEDPYEKEFFNSTLLEDQEEDMSNLFFLDYFLLFKRTEDLVWVKI